VPPPFSRRSLEATMVVLMVFATVVTHHYHSSLVLLPSVPEDRNDERRQNHKTKAVLHPGRKNHRRLVLGSRGDGFRKSGRDGIAHGELVKPPSSLGASMGRVVRPGAPKTENGHGTTVTTRREDRGLRLRYDWTNLSPSLDLAKHILNHQSDCSLPVSTFTYRNRFGLGSDLHVYGQALGYGIESNRRLRTIGNWTWMDRNECSITASNDGGGGSGDGDGGGPGEHGPHRAGLGSPMRCYFAASELNCPGDVEHAVANPGFDPDHGLSKANGNLVPFHRGGDSVVAAGVLRGENGERVLQKAVVEALFARTTPLVVREAERQLNLVFAGEESVPGDLITVHVRWGDKVATYQGKKRKRMPEMKKVDVSEYIDAVHRILDQRDKNKDNYDSSSKDDRQTSLPYSNKRANIYLATEDPEAVREFRKAIPSGWNLFVDQFLIETTHHRIDEYNGGPKMAKASNGRAGFLALGSLLVAMEANDFVLTTASNWSRLMDELRQTILDSRCGNCTSVVDLRRQ